MQICIHNPLDILKCSSFTYYSISWLLSGSPKYIVISGAVMIRRWVIKLPITMFTPVMMAVLDSQLCVE